MLHVNPYLNFDGNAYEAFLFYKSVFGGELFVQKMKDMPPMPDMPPLTDAEKECVMHVALPLDNGQTLMASDCLKSQGHQLTKGNNNYISIAPESREEADRLFQGLSAGGAVEMPMADMFWGDYFGSFKDKFGMYWMINFSNKK
ncbi:MULTISPECIES: VOC family protein [Chitinophagaceae]